MYIDDILSHFPDFWCQKQSIYVIWDQQQIAFEFLNELEAI